MYVKPETKPFKTNAKEMYQDRVVILAFSGRISPREKGADRLYSPY